MTCGVLRFRGAGEASADKGNDPLYCLYASCYAEVEMAGLFTAGFRNR